MRNSLLAAIEYVIEPINYQATITIKSSLDGNLINEGVDRYKSLNSKHLEAMKQGSEDDKIFLLVKTNQSNHHIAEAACHKVFLNNKEIETLMSYETETARVSASFQANIGMDQQLTLEKTVAVCSDKEDFVDDALSTALSNLKRENRFSDLLSESTEDWNDLWQKADIQIGGCLLYTSPSPRD